MPLLMPLRWTECGPDVDLRASSGVLYVVVCLDEAIDDAGRLSRKVNTIHVGRLSRSSPLSRMSKVSETWCQADGCS